MKIVIKGEKKESLTLADLKPGDACKLKRVYPQTGTKREIFAIVTDLEPSSPSYKRLLEIEDGAVFEQESDTPAERLENAEFRPYGAGIDG